ncbi:MAG: hypothetical protein R3F19_15360 [Verrucomicrobiales bacterium]
MMETRFKMTKRFTLMILFHCHRMNAEQVVEFLWRKGKIPEWIDISVVTVDHDVTVCELRCCGRYTGNEDRLYYRPDNRSPFAIKSPSPPPNYTFHPDEIPEKFQLFDPKVLRRLKRQ